MPVPDDSSIEVEALGDVYGCPDTPNVLTDTEMPPALTTADMIQFVTTGVPEVVSLAAAEVVSAEIAVRSLVAAVGKGVKRQRLNLLSSLIEAATASTIEEEPSNNTPTDKPTGPTQDTEKDEKPRPVSVTSELEMFRAITAHVTGTGGLPIISGARQAEWAQKALRKMDPETMRPATKKAWQEMMITTAQIINPDLEVQAVRSVLGQRVKPGPRPARGKTSVSKKAEVGKEGSKPKPKPSVPDWRDSGQCYIEKASAKWFFPERPIKYDYTSITKYRRALDDYAADKRAAMQVCGRCAIKDTCLEKAIVTKQDGIWGGVELLKGKPMNSNGRGRPRKQASDPNLLATVPDPEH